MPSLLPTAVADDEGRYTFERTLGQGAAGSVYLVRDRETGEQLALKKLLRMDARTVLRLKREFRSLADVHHPNLVKLYDLGRASDAWFLTMEYVSGSVLPVYLQRPPAPGVDPLTRLAATFHQLACGVQALHRASMLHRDLKPNNVLVSDQDRVVVLDFGLVRELDEESAKVTEDGLIAGTPAYMAPEQVLGTALSEACDWYAFGVMLYEALSGELPFDGRTMQVLNAKLTVDPPALHELAPEAPRDLSALCMQLLQRDPAARPSGDEVLRALALKPTAARSAPLRRDVAPPKASSTSIVPMTTVVGETTLQTDTSVARQSTPELFGRDAELEQLWDELDRVQDGTSAVVHVRGTSGGGKSALVEQFLGQVATTHRGIGSAPPLTLRSRCYEREAMPFKALDGVMDALVRHLASLEDVEVGHMLPSDIAVLARLFPVIERLRAVQSLLTTAKSRADGVHDRQRAEHALRELFSRVAARSPVVLWIDDLQWGDLDSARILAGWLDKPIAAPLLLVFSYRSEEVTTSSCLRSLLTRAADPGTTPAHEHVISLSPLTIHAVEALCARRLGARADAHPELVARIVRESQGSPYLALQLATLAEAKITRGDDLDTLSVGELVEQMGPLLAGEARDLLSTLAIAGRPMSPKLALRAAGVKRDGRSHVHALRGMNLVRTRDVGGERLLECYHDRVRESVQQSLDPEQRRRIHEDLLRVLEFSGQADASWLHSLALGAKRTDQALHYGLLAAERASATLAFERAAELYQTCLQLSPDPAANGGELWSKLALSLACCGRGGRAAEAYLEAAKHASAQNALTFTRFAASHLVRSGRFEEGEAQVRKVLEAMQIRVPETERATLAAVVWEQARLKLRGTAFTPRSEQELPAHMLAQLDALDALSVETQSYDPIRAALFVSRGIRLALDAGEPVRVVRALSAAAVMSASGGPSGARRTEELLARAMELAQQVGSEQTLAGVYSSRAVCAFMLGRPKEVLEPSYEAERLFRADSRHDYYRRFAAVSARMGALHILGEHKRFRSELRAALTEARATENTGAQLQLTLNHTVAEELEGQPELSIARLDRQRAELPRSRFGTLHVLHLAAVLAAGGATREFEWAEAHCREAWPAYERSPIRRNAMLALLVHAMRGRMRLNRFVLEGGSGDPASLVDTRAIEKLKLYSSKPIVMHTRARLAVLRGDKSLAIQLLTQSADLYTACDRACDALRERYALGVLIGGDRGEAMRADAEQQLRARGYDHPVRAMQVFFPELLGWG